MYSTIVDTAKLSWTALDFPGVFMRVVHEDKKSEGMTVMTRLEPGASIPAHLHTRADETVFVISGDFIEEGVEYEAGSFFCRSGRHFSRSASDPDGLCCAHHFFGATGFSNGLGVGHGADIKKCAASDRSH